MNFLLSTIISVTASLCNIMPQLQCSHSLRSNLESQPIVISYRVPVQRGGGEGEKNYRGSFMIYHEMLTPETGLGNPDAVCIQVLINPSNSNENNQYFLWSE